MGIILVQQEDFFNLLLIFHESRQCFDLHGRVGIKAKMPITALGVGEVRVHGRVIQKEHLFTRISFVVFVDRLNNRPSHSRAVALYDIVDPLID